MDVKCPSSGEAERNCLDNLRRLTVHDEIKFVIGDRGDYEYARNVLSAQAGDGRFAAPPLFSAAYGRMAPDTLAKWILEDGLDVRLQIQLHKVIWGQDKRGV